MKHSLHVRSISPLIQPANHKEGKPVIFLDIIQVCLGMFSFETVTSSLLEQITTNKFWFFNTCRALRKMSVGLMMHSLPGQYRH